MYGESEYGSTDYGSVKTTSQNYFSSLSDTLTLSDVKTKARTRVLLDAFSGFIDSFDTVQARGLEFIDNINLTEIFKKASTRTLYDIGTLSDVLSRSIGRHFTFTDAFSGLTDTIIKIRNKFKTFNETLTLSEIVLRVKGFTLLEMVTLSDSIVRNYGRMLYLIDSFSGLTDTIRKASTRIFRDTTNLSDVIRKFIDGLLINPWNKIVKTVAVFSKILKPTATYSKTAKPTDVWTKDSKPY